MATPLFSQMRMTPEANFDISEDAIFHMLLRHTAKQVAVTYNDKVPHGQRKQETGCRSDGYRMESFLLLVL